MILRLLLLSITLSVLFINKANAAEYYVATTGSDSNSGSASIEGQALHLTLSNC